MQNHLHRDATSVVAAQIQVARTDFGKEVYAEKEDAIGRGAAVERTNDQLKRQELTSSGDKSGLTADWLAASTPSEMTQVRIELSMSLLFDYLYRYRSLLI